MKKLSNTYWTCVIIGLLFSIGSFLYGYNQHVSASVFCAVWGFIFLWVPQMFPDYDKYKN